MIRKAHWRFFQQTLMLFWLSLSPVIVNEARSAPLLEDVSIGVYPAARGFFTLFDILLVVLILFFFSRRYRHQR